MPCIRWAVIALLIVPSLTSAADPANDSPVVRMLIPGFRVRELPVELSNINNLRFAPNGMLTALGYDGRVHLLYDSDSDGLEDTAKTFWDKPTLRVPVGMAWSKEGLFVSSQGKVSLLKDLDGDWRADEEEVIATGWPPTDVGSGGVDATALTLDAEGNVYFGLLVADYSNAYRIKDGVSHYDLNSPRGTIQKWSAQTRELETIATGIRVPYALAFNNEGDLFLTDQEGETWMPNGNPLDELNQIVAGGNYGFPPRHEKWLPDLVSEPPVAVFGPQHQSTCGLAFNREGEGRFGPPWWSQDAFVAGESRGKLWRVQLVKTASGYVSREFLIARLSMLTTDLTVSPRGALYVSCHSGLPDWGTGPNGKGKLFRIEYVDQNAPQPIAIWPASASETRILFHKPVDSEIEKELNNIRIEHGQFVRAADRYEVLKPPYEVVRRQDASPRHPLKVTSARLRKPELLVVGTEGQPHFAWHAVTIPHVGSPGGLQSVIDLDYSLNGVQVRSVRQSDGESKERALIGWWPHPIANVSKQFLKGAPPDLLKEAFDGDHIVELSSLWRPPGKHVQLRIIATAPFELRLGQKSAASEPRDGQHQARLGAVAAPEGLPVSVRFKPSHDDKPEILDFASATEIDSKWRVVPPRDLFLPWGTQPSTQPAESIDQEVLIAGGDYERGRALFFGGAAQCAACHQIRGEGSLFGPNLDNLAHRDPASVLRDLLDPSALINPDYVGYRLELKSGEQIDGLIRQEKNKIRVLSAAGVETTLNPADILELRPSSVSLMPSGLVDAISEKERRDLLTFLVSAPPKRDWSQLSETLNLSLDENAPGETKPVRVVLVASKQDHGKGQHDYPAWQEEWSHLLSRAPAVDVQKAWLWPSEEMFQSANAIVFYYWNRAWDEKKFRQLDVFLEKGGGIVLLHSAVIADGAADQLATRIGLAAQPGRTGYLHMPFDLEFETGADTLLPEKFPRRMSLLDEPYWPMVAATNEIEVLASVEIDEERWPMMWTYSKGRGRVFATIAGHYTWTLQDPAFQLVVLRGLAWTMNEPLNRFQQAITPARQQ